MITINKLFNTDINIQGVNFRIQKIVIPEIQRDYVQGLEEYTNQLNNFLDVLFKALSSEDKCSLDFIYGNIENGVFEPIDGQQRITTLALLYYYIENICNENINNNIFNKIVYKTKNTATDFCRLLSKEYFIKYLHENKKNEIISIIKDYKEYYDFYDYDLTIESMINTLNSIHIKYEKLSDKSNLSFDNISFQIFPMKNFKLSDDLYIKMNGRGKQLSSFDNFKADYFKWLEENINIIDELIPNITESSEDNNKDKEEDKEKERKKHKLETLKRKFDTDYIDIFWDYALKNSEDTDETPDPEKLFFRFINRFVISKSDLSILPNDFINNSENLDYEYSSQLFDIYKKCFEKNHNIFITLLMNLTNIKNINDYFQTSWVYKFDKDNEINFNIFDKFTYKDRFAYNNIMRFFEQENAVKNLDEAKKYSRIIWNITEQFFTVYEVGKDNYIIAINGINEVIPNIDWGNIYESFNKLSIQQSEPIIKKIIFDEKRKCECIRDNPKLEQKFIKLEKLPYLKGSIGFLLGTNKEDFGNIYDNAFSVFSPTSKDNMLNNGEFIKLLVYTIFDNIYSDILNNNSDILFNKLFDDISIRKYLIIEDIFKSKAYSVIKEKPNIPAKYDDFIEKYINDFNDNLRDVFIIYCVAALLYFKDSNTKEYIINTHFIDTTKFPCIMENNYKKYAYYGLYKRFASIIVEQNICNFIEKITQNNSIIYNNNNADVYLIKFDINNNVYKAYNHLIYGNDGTIMLFLKIHDIKYTLWFLYNPEEYTFGLTDETDSNNKVEYKMNYVKEKFASDLENIMNCIQELANDRNLTLSEYMKKIILTK